MFFWTRPLLPSTNNPTSKRPSANIQAPETAEGMRKSRLASPITDPRMGQNAREGWDRGGGEGRGAQH